ncbi:MAG TPA: hypothetical protein VJ954_00700, partial [Ignavibacteriaceae bacterium]|nr:hypothetical protein [Ignavibacteriaceae bacterium]
MKFIFSVPDILEIKEKYVKSETVYRRGQRLVDNEMCTLISESGNKFNFLVEDRFDDFNVTISQTKTEISFQCTCSSNLSARKSP